MFLSLSQNCWNKSKNFSKKKLALNFSSRPVECRCDDLNEVFHRNRKKLKKIHFNKVPSSKFSAGLVKRSIDNAAEIISTNVRKLSAKTRKRCKFRNSWNKPKLLSKPFPLDTKNAFLTTLQIFSVKMSFFLLNVRNWWKKLPF